MNTRTHLTPKRPPKVVLIDVRNPCAPWRIETTIRRTRAASID